MKRHTPVDLRVNWSGLLLGLFLLFIGVPVTAGEALAVRHLAVWVDPGGQADIAQVSAPDSAARFTPLKHNLSAGYTRNVHWLRFEVQAPVPGEWWLEIQPSMLDDLRLYEPLQAGFRERHMGDTLPFSQREVTYRGFVFRLDLPDRVPHTFYLRVQTTSTSLVLLNLWQPRDFYAAVNAENALFGFYYGFVALVLLLCLGVWLWLRDALFGWFSLHVFSALLLYLGVNGFIGEYVFPHSPHLANLWIGACVFFSMSVSAPFVRRILRVEAHHTFYLFMVRLMLWLPLLLSLSLFTNHYTEAMRLAMMMMLGMAGVSLWRAFELWRAGWEESPYILVGVVITLLGGVLAVVSLLGFNPGNFFLASVRQVTGLSSMFAMFLALAVRFSAMREASREAQERARQAEREAVSAREAHVEQGRFIAMLSHELKTPLAVIDGATQSLQRLNREGDVEMARRHARIRDAVARINRLVEQFLATDRFDHADLGPRSIEFDLAALLQQCATAHAESLARVRLHAPASLYCMADPALVRVALTNLLDNALKYSPEHAEVLLSARACTEGGVEGIEITVTDAGRGVPQALGERLFARYVRGDNARGVSGAGLGLYLVRRIAEVHGGTIGVLPVASGACFRLWLPRGISA